MEEAVRDSVAEQRERLMESLRIYGGHYAEFGRRFAAWLDLHSTDATAVLEIAAAEERGTPLSPARLSERISLSTGATTALLNRLEAAEHITRTREHSDRRVVTPAAARTSRNERTSSSTRSPSASTPRCRTTRPSSWNGSKRSWPT